MSSDDQRINYLVEIKKLTLLFGTFQFPVDRFKNPLEDARYSLTTCCAGWPFVVVTQCCVVEVLDDFRLKYELLEKLK